MYLIFNLISQAGRFCLGPGGLVQQGLSWALECYLVLFCEHRQTFQSYVQSSCLETRSRPPGYSELRRESPESPQLSKCLSRCHSAAVDSRVSDFAFQLLNLVLLNVEFAHFPLHFQFLYAIHRRAFPPGLTYKIG